MKSPLPPKRILSSIGKPAAVDPKFRGGLAPVFMLATFSLLGVGILCTFAGSLVLGLMGMPTTIAFLAGHTVFTVAAFMGGITFVYCIRNG